MNMVEVDELQVAYERVGSGPALVLLHGYVGDGPTTWRRQLDGLSDEFTVVAWDAPGAGRSSDPPELFGLDGYADCLAGFLDKLGLSTACVAGLSFGGILGLALQRRHPARPSALVLASAYAGWAGSLPPKVAEQRLRQALTLGRRHAGGIRRCVVADDVLQADAARHGGRVPRQHAGVSPGRLSGHGTGVCRGPPRCTASHRRADVAGVRRAGCASAVGRRRGPAGSHLRLEARRLAGRRARLQRRSFRPVQLRGPRLPSREAQLDPPPCRPLCVGIAAGARQASPAPDLHFDQSGLEGRTVVPPVG